MGGTGGPPALPAPSGRERTRIENAGKVLLASRGDPTYMTSVKASDLFGVIVRATGFLIIIYGFWEIWGGFENFAENILSASQGDSSEQTSSFSYFAFGIPAVLAGAILFFLADWVVRAAYRHSGDSSAGGGGPLA